MTAGMGAMLLPLPGEPGFFRNPKDPLGGGFNYFLFSPLFGEDSHFD